MLRLYEKYLESVDNFLVKCFESQKSLIKCKPGCSICCEAGEYPFSPLEMEYLMEGFLALKIPEQQYVKDNIRNLLLEKSRFNGRFMHKCPFLSSNRQCLLYERRGIVCRVHGLAYFEDVDGEKLVKLPECSRLGLNYSEVFDGNEVLLTKFNQFDVKAPIQHSLNLNFFQKELLKGVYGLEFGEIRPLLDWFINTKA